MRAGGRGGGQDGESSYHLAGGGREAAEGDRLNLLEQIFDPLSRQRLPDQR